MQVTFPDLGAGSESSSEPRPPREPRGQAAVGGHPRSPPQGHPPWLGHGAHHHGWLRLGAQPRYPATQESLDLSHAGFWKKTRPQILKHFRLPLEQSFLFLLNCGKSQHVIYWPWSSNSILWALLCWPWRKQISMM